MTEYFYPIASTGPGVTVSNYKRNPALDARVEKIGKISDRAAEARKCGDALELLRIAQEYEDNFKHMKCTAYLLRLEAEEMRTK